MGHPDKKRSERLPQMRDEQEKSKVKTRSLKIEGCGTHVLPSG
jgi:hypothetical protein